MRRDDNEALVRERFARVTGVVLDRPETTAGGRFPTSAVSGWLAPLRSPTGSADPAAAHPLAVDPLAVDPLAVEPGLPVRVAIHDGAPPVAGDAERVAGALAAFSPGRRGVRALALIGLVVALLAGGFAWYSRPQVQPVRPQALTGATGVVPSSQGEVVVSVAGRVAHPGLVRLPPGARVADAVEAAGGALPGTDISFVNFARRVVDGEMILIGVTPPPGVAVEGAAQSGGAVNLNTATLAQLDGLPGVGPVLAQRILDYRAKHGGFRSTAELKQIEGISDARYEHLKDLVTA
jgi:competence protein ComEA